MMQALTRMYSMFSAKSHLMYILQMHLKCCPHDMACALQNTPHDTVCAYNILSFSLIYEIYRNP